MNSKKTLADKIGLLVTTTPATFNSDDEAEETKAKVVDHYDESDDSDNNFQVSDIRKRNVDLLDQVDKRYKGKKVSRKDVYNTDDNDFDLHNASESEDENMNSMEEQSDDDTSDSNNMQNEDDYDTGDDESNDDNSNDDSEQDPEDEEEESVTDGSQDNTSVMRQEKDIQTMSQTNIREDIEKGNCVKNQLQLWENLLEIRIKFQKCLATSNQMPQYDVYKDLKTDTEFMKQTDETTNNLKDLLNNMLQLQTFLLKQYPETKNICMSNRKRKATESIEKKIENTDDPMDEEIPSDTEDENEDKNETMLDEDSEDFNQNIFKKKLKLNDYGEILSDNHKSYTEYRNAVIQKWNEKTRIAGGKLERSTETTLKQIEFALNDKEKLRKKSRLKRSEYKIVGKTEEMDDNDGRRVQEYDSEIYDDDDFYHQLLRDLIEHKSSDVTDPIQLSKQWIQLQNMRSKMKKKIDTRATKGRKIRYNVHNKLVNYMAPIVINDTWTDNAKNDLYNSLFGKIRPKNKEVDR